MTTLVAPSHRKLYALHWPLDWMNGQKFVLRLLLCSIRTFFGHARSLPFCSFIGWENVRHTARALTGWRTSLRTGKSFVRGVSLRKRYVSERIDDIVELYGYVSWYCFTVSLVCDSPDPRNTSKSLSMREMWCDQKQLLFQCRHCLINKLLRL